MSTSYLSLVGHWADGHSQWNTHLNKNIFRSVEDYLNFLARQDNTFGKEYAEKMTVYVYDTGEKKASSYKILVRMPSGKRKIPRDIEFAETCIDEDTVEIDLSMHYQEGKRAWFYRSGNIIRVIQK